MSHHDDPLAPPHDPYAALRFPSYRFYLAGSVVAQIGMQMGTTAVQWEIWERTKSGLALGLVGLVQFLPVISLVLLTGQAADRFNRVRIVQITTSLFALASLALALVSATRADYRLMFVCLLATGTARAFQQPAKASLLPQLVPIEHFRNAVTWNTTTFQVATIAGPALSGLLIAVFRQTMVVYAIDALMGVGFLLCMFFVRLKPTQRVPRAMSLDEFSAGLRYLGRNRVVLGAIVLDMFAVLLGGAAALMPVYAKDILFVGPQGYGWLRAAPAIGALAMVVILAHRPPPSRSGHALLWSVVGFGAATIVFGLSRNYWLSLAMLLLTGMLDTISVVIRHTLVQVLTPDELRGRVSAVNSLFIGASNELGGFESGAVAQAFGPTFSVVSGGVGTILVVAAVALGFPRLRRYGRLGASDEEPSS
jgi:MFS family permease